MVHDSCLDLAAHPKKIIQHMNAPGLKRENISSHLQVCILKGSAIFSNFVLELRGISVKIYKHPFDIHWDFNMARNSNN